MYIYIFVCLAFYATPFIITTSMSDHRALAKASVVTGVPLTLIVVQIMRESNDPHNNASIGLAFVIVPIAMAIMGLVSGVVTSLVLQYRTRQAASSQARLGIRLAGFVALPAAVYCLIC
ncbi:hypothetical protein [Undibacterium sp. TS12]|uniref:hypothetical protein n=1 Tax=Undibacterium sp. TS12 TaxID=2908202 RepID=UPI001F4C80FE|nr:hypothetical protein [Undibacterium sp. TS12]MCH8622459.1 hypothetical protein [Undibacterium sp. TS12]